MKSRTASRIFHLAVASYIAVCVGQGAGHGEASTSVKGRNGKTIEVRMHGTKKAPSRRIPDPKMTTF